MNTLKWVAFPGTDVTSYKIYRSFIGFIAPIVDLNGLTLQLKINNGPTQSFTFVSGDPVAQINATISGGKAYTTSDSLNFILRSNLKEAPGSIQIVGGTALSALGLSARTIFEKSEDSLITTVTANIDLTVVMSYDDMDGDILDYYAMSFVNSSSVESAKSDYRHPTASTEPICVIEGLVLDLQGVTVADAKVIATVVSKPEDLTPMAGITLEQIVTQSREDGRFSLPLLQGSLVKLEIEALKYSHMVRIPAQPFALLNDLVVDTEYRYPLGYRGSR